MSSQSKTKKFLLFCDGCTRWIASAAVFTLAVKTASVENVRVPFYILGSILTAFLGKGLKRALAVKRPDGARQGGHGMPSSHANCSSYLATAAGIGVWYYYDRPVFPISTFAAYSSTATTTGSDTRSQGSSWMPGGGSVHQVEMDCLSFLISHPIPLLLELACVWVCALRWYGDSHTIPQLAAGYALGKACLFFVLHLDVVIFPLLAELEISKAIAENKQPRQALNDGINTYLSEGQKIFLFSIYFIACWAFAGKYVRKWWKGDELKKSKTD